MNVDFYNRETITKIEKLLEADTYIIDNLA